MFNQIWKKFSIALLIVAFIPIGYFGYQDLEAAKSSVLDETLRMIFLNCETRAKEIERIFSNAQADINYLRASFVIQMLPDFSNTNNKVEFDTPFYWKSLVEREFKLFLSVKEGYSRIGYLDAYGSEIVEVFKNSGQVFLLKEHQKRNRVTSTHFVEAARQEGYGVAAIPMRITVDPNMDLRGVTLIRYATKVFDRNGKPAGVIYIDLNGSEIYYALSHTSLEQKRPAALTFHKGNYIFNPFLEQKQGIPPEPLPKNVNDEFSYQIAEQILSGRRGIIEDEEKDLFAYRAIYPQIGNSELFYVVYDRQPRSKITERLNKIKNKYLVGAVGAFLLCIVVAVGVSRRLTRNLAKLREGVENIRQHRLNYRLNIRSHDEIESLANAYNMMAESLKEYSDSLEKKVEERSERIRQVEHKLMQVEKMAAIGFLSAGVAHEVNNPISIIITRLELIKKAVERGQVDKIRKDLDVLYNHATRVGKITGDLLAFSRQSSSECSAVELNTIINRVISLTEFTIRKKRIELHKALAPDLPLVWANASKLEQAIYNIIYNSYQATDPGGKITIKSMPNENRGSLLEIADTGRGIAKDTIKHIFEPFFTTKEMGEGAGLGLSISYGIIQEFGGTINVQSNPGKGTIFTIILGSAEKLKSSGSHAALAL